MTELVTQRSTNTERYSVLQTGNELAKQLVANVTGRLENALTGEPTRDYPAFSPADTDVVSMQVDEDVAETPLDANLTLRFDREALGALGLSLTDLRYFTRVRDTQSAWTYSELSLPELIEGDEVTFEFKLSEILPSGSVANSEISIDILSTICPVDFWGWSPSIKLSSLCVRHGGREDVTDFPPVWKTPEQFKTELHLPEETLAYFEPGSMEAMVGKAILYVNTEYEDEIQGSSGAAGVISRVFIALAKAEMIEACLIRQDFSLDVDYEAGTVGEAIQALLKAEGHRVMSEGLKFFQEDRDESQPHSLTALCCALGKNEVRKMLR